jgi:hypothetical protein
LGARHPAARHRLAAQSELPFIEPPGSRRLRHGDHRADVAAGQAGVDLNQSIIGHPYLRCWLLLSNIDRLDPLDSSVRGCASA